jgi:hypothetical protein
MDPTPAVTEEVAGSRWQALARITDHLRLRWNRLFIQYSGADQMAVVREVKAGSVSMTNRIWETLRAVPFAPLALQFASTIRRIVDESGLAWLQWAGVALLTMASTTWLVMKQPWVKRRRSGLPPQEQAITQLYRNMVSQFSRHGLLKRDGTPPLEFLSMIRETWKPAEEEATTITQLYCRVRFGHATLTEAELQQARDSLRRLLALKRTPVVH